MNDDPMCASGWRPECPADELMLAFFRVRRALQATSHGVDPGAFPILHELAIHGPQRQGQLAEAVGLDASTTSRHVRGLIGSGMIDARRDAADGRASVLSLAAPGLDFLNRHMSAKREAFQLGTRSFSEGERAELIRLLEMFAADLEGAQAAPRPVGRRTPSVDLRVGSQPDRGSPR